MPVTLESLFDAHAAASLDKQFALEQAVGDADWSLDLDAGELSFSNGRTFTAQLLGTESHHSSTWLWGWANQSIGGSEILTTANTLRRYGADHHIPEFTEPSFSLERADGHLLSLIAAGLCTADAYYQAPYDGGAAFLLLQAPELRQFQDSSPAHLNRVFLQRITGLPCNHRTAFEAYVRYKGYTWNEEPEGIQVISPRGEWMRPAFDAQGRLTHLEFAVQPDAPQVPGT